LQIAADRLGISGQEIEDALRDQEGVSFEEFVANRRLEQAFQQLGERSPAADGPYEVIRARRRVLIPKTTVKYQVHGFLFRKSEYSNQCPLVDLSSEGLAFLSDEAPKPPKSVSLLLKFPGGESALRVEGRVVYLVATGIAGYRYRVGVKFLPFAHERGCNDPKTLDILHNLEKTYDS
jgi:AraC-like DNA-binding protein